MNFSDIFSSVVRYFTPGKQDIDLEASLEEFKTLLKAEETIRMWVSGAPGYAYLTSTINLLYQLTDNGEHGFGYEGIVEVYYQNNKAGTTLSQLYNLLPDLDKQKEGTVNKATVKLIEWKKGDAAPKPEVKLGFTGGEDQDKTARVIKTSPALAARINTTYFLRLEPYLWSTPDEIQFLDIKRSTIDLGKQKVLQYGAFGQRPYWEQVPVLAPQWDYYRKNNYQSQVDALLSLLEQTEDFDIAVTGGITTKDDYQLQAPPEGRMLEVITGYLASQMEGSAVRRGAKPIIIISLDDFSNSSSGTRTTLPQLMRGERTAQEKSWEVDVKAGGDGTKEFSQKRLNELRQLLKPSDYRAQYLAGINADKRVRYVWNTAKESLDEAYTWLKEETNRVLLVQIGKMPPPVFSYMMYKTGMPAVFAGTDIANLAIQLGKPYFNVGKPNESKVLYPTTLLGFTSFNLLPLAYVPMVYVPKLVSGMQQTANKINFRLEVWPAVADKNPAETIGDFIRKYYSTEEGEYHTYYKKIQEFYKKPEEDKFRVGAGYLSYVMKPADPAKNPLTELLAKLYANMEKEKDADKYKLNLFPGVYGSGAIYNFVSGLLGKEVTLTDAKIEPAKDAKDIKEIIVKGKSSVLDNVPLDFDIKFTVYHGSVLSEWKMTYTGDWLTTELPWLLFESPYVSLTVADATLPAQGSVGGLLQGLGLDFSIRMPISSGVWQLEGHFGEPMSVAKFYQLAGGVNLVQALPAPFNALSAIGVTDCQMAYNSNTGSIEYVSFVMATKGEVTLLQGLSMDSITLNVLVQNPGSLANRNTTWSVAGKFTIGDKSAEDAGVVMVGMDYPGPVLSGQLESGVIKVADLFNLFLPGTVFNPEGYLPVITGFEASFDGTSGDYSVTSQLNFNWKFDIMTGAPSVTINQVGVRVQSQNKQLQGGISGGITIAGSNNETLLAMSLSANYDSESGWVFMGCQNPDAPLSLADLAKQFLPSTWKIGGDEGDDGNENFNLKDLGFTFREKTKYYEITGATDGFWDISFLGLKVRADLKFGYGKYGAAKTSDKVKLLSKAGMPLAVKEDEAGYYCTINADIEWIGIKMKLFYDYNPKVLKYGFTWGVLTGYITKEKVGNDPVPHNVGTLKFTDSVTLGSMVEEVISWFSGYKYGLSAPWNFLNSIPLSALELKYDFTAKTVSFNLTIGEINLGFCKITKIGVNYQSGKPTPEENGVFVSIEGSFPWLIGNDNPPGQSPDKLTWDASKPEKTPAPSGQGNKYLDLRMLALGQHVTIPGFASATSVQEAIAAMGKLPNTKPGEIPGIVFDSNSSWLIGMDFGILKLEDDKKKDKAALQALAGKDAKAAGSGYFIDLQIVFNDPNLYALRVALSGEPARMFKGLDFQILYRKISDSVGVYQAQIALPDVMRKIQLGAVNITLPVFGLEIYTNGDFVVDLGFPKNADFSRSFTLQMIIYVPIPIPIMGSAGLYFGKKSSATSTEVPVIDNGTFNPVLVFGVGIQFGLGYDFNAGILAAGFSLTFVAIIEGVLAKFNPYKSQDISTGSQSDIAPAYYYSVKGVVGIQGKLFGYVDFKIIKAEVSIALSVLADITITAYAPILLGITASVSVSVSIKINLGFFSIKIGFSFSMTIRASYQIKAGGGKAPWNTVSGPKSGRNDLLRHGTIGTSFKLNAQEFLTALQDNFTGMPTWSNLTAPVTKADLKGYLGFGLSIAGDKAATLQDQQAVYTAMLFIDSVASATEDPHTANLKAAGTASDTSFEILSKQIFRWVLAAFHNGAVSAAEIDQIAVSQVRLQVMFDYLNNPDNADPLPVEAIDAFMNSQVKMRVSHPSEKGDANAAYFPIAPKLGISLPAFGQQPALNYSFDAYNALSGSYVHDLRAYFDELAVKMQEEQRSARLLMSEDVVLNHPESLATFIYADYFLMIARQMIQNALDALHTFQYQIQDNQSVRDILTWINSNGQFGQSFSYTMADLFDSNKAHSLNADRSIKLNMAIYTTVSEDTFDSISKKTLYNGGFTATALADVNKENTNILQGGMVIEYPGKTAIVVHAGNSLASIANDFKVTIEELLGKSNVLQLAGLLMPSSKIILPSFSGKTQAADTLISFSARYGISIELIALEPVNADIVGLFDRADRDGQLTLNNLPQFQAGELIREIQANKGLQQLSGMSSRYYLSGLRLPTEGIMPSYQGMWVDKDMKYTENTAGLFSLTGQQFPLPVLQKDESYAISFTIPETLSWMLFDNGTGSMSIAIAQDSATYTQIQTVRSYAQQHYLDLDIEQLGAGDMFSSSYGHYSFSTVSPWQTGSAVLLPYGGKVSETQSLNIWALPNDLISLADPAGRAVAPRFSVQTGTVDPVTQAIQSVPVNNYGWGTQVTFSIKRVPLSPDSPASATTYEISGADGNNALILEQMVTYLNNNDSLVDFLAFGFSPNQAGGSNPGIQTDPMANLTIGVAQANLSTFTRPEGALHVSARLAAQAATSNLLNKPTELITLLWQASITRGGGYYLYYYNTENGEGLPDHAFNDKGEAMLSLIVVYNAPADSKAQNLLQPYMNIFVTGDPVNISDSTLYAKADPVVQQVAFGEKDTLNSKAFAYFTNIGDVAEGNPDAVLTGGLDIDVPEGVYQVIDPQGTLLTTIATTFGTTVDKIKEANPLKKEWPATLPLYTGLRLPPLTVKAGSGANTKTLAAIAAFYGMDLTALANYNSDKPGLFVTGTSLKMIGGPVARVATVPAGVVALEAIRKEPGEIPAGPADDGYASLFLQHNFSILTFNLTGNSWFKASKPSLPAGPTDPPTGTGNTYGRTPDLKGKWVFRQSVPYARFANQASLKATGMPDINTSPYKGIGYLVQADFTWLDIYGNTVLTTLSQPPVANAKVINQAPLLTGYTDTLLGVNQWPSVASAWKVASGDGVSVQVPLSFDTSQYNGLLSAKATSSTTILLSFTETLLPATAAVLANYKLSPELSIAVAALQPDNKSVVLTVAAMAEDMEYSIAIGNIQNSANTETFNGQATFSYPDIPGTATSSIVQQAAQDFQVYTQLWYQLTDPNGIAFSMHTSLYPRTDFPVDQSSFRNLLDNWIAPIYLYLQDRSQGGTTVAAPEAVFSLNFPVDPAQVNKAQIFEITTSLLMERTGGAVMGDFETTGGIKNVTTLLSAATNAKADTTKGLDDFTVSFEKAMSVNGSYNLKIATGADREKLGQQTPDGTIWAVRLGVDDQTPIAYKVTNPDKPVLFAPKPVSNKLESRTGVSIYNYTTGTGIDFNNPSSKADFTEIDLDRWIGTFFGAMDNILTPEFTASIQLIDKKLNRSYLHNIQDSKESLADIAKLLMVPVFEGPAVDASSVQEALKQALLAKLTNLYTTNSGIQFDVAVKADVPTGTPANLYGNFIQNTLLEGAVSKDGSLRTITLYFSAALDPDSAKDKANYTLSDSLTVISAEPSADGLQVVLTASGNCILGQTTVTISAALVDRTRRPVQGKRTDTVSTGYVSYAKPDQLTITAAKIRLDAASTQPLAFLLSTPEIVRGQKGEVLSKIDLNLSYKGTDIEHQIAAPVNGFTPSSWLSFVLPNERVPLESQLGGFSVPMFLRSFPVNPSLVNQAGITPNTENPDISKLLEWSYVFDYAQSFHYPQDTLYCTVNFNVSDKSKQNMLRALPDAFNQLAEFITIYPSVDIDLKAFVTKIDASVFYDDSPAAALLFKNAGVALESFVAMTQRVVAAAKTGNGLMMRSSPNGFGSMGVEAYKFEIQEGPRSLDGKQVQVVSVYGAPPAGVGVAEVWISPETYTMQPWTNPDDPCTGTACYYYVHKITGDPLLSDEAQGIQGRQVVLPQLNILQRQDAMTSVHLTRNENLIPGKKTSPDFVYTTGDLSFSNPYLPTINSYQEIEIADLPENKGKGTRRSLFDQLKVLMDTLLLENTEPVLRFQMSSNYSYTINEGLPSILLPVIMQPLVRIDLATGLDKMLQDWADAISGWLTSNKPNTRNGSLKFDLVIFSNLTEQPYPLLRLTSLNLDLDYIIPA